MNVLQNISLCYHIRPNYRTVRLSFSKLFGKLVVKYVSTYAKGTLKKRSAKDLSNGAYEMFVCVSFSDFRRIRYLKYTLFTIIHD